MSALPGHFHAGASMSDGAGDQSLFWETPGRVVESSEQARVLLDLEQLATLSGIASRPLLESMLASFSYARAGTPTRVSLLFFALDRLQNLQAFRPDVAELAVASVSTTVAAIIRPFDTFGQWLNGQFLIITPGLELREAFELGERIRRLTNAIRIHLPHQQLRLSLSLVATGIDASESGSAAMQRAIRALNEQKLRGFGRLSVA
jgi:GGDEF domain-containing protein